MSKTEDIETRVTGLKKAIKEVGISQNKLLMRYASDKYDHDDDAKSEVERLKKALQPSRQNITEADLNALFDCLAMINQEMKNDLVVSSSVKGAIVDDKLSNIFSKLSKKLDKKLATIEE